MPDLLAEPMTAAIVALLGYLLGSVPFGIVVARLFGLGDLRSIGSGNIGTTNVLRTGNKLAALLTLLLDAGKGAAAVLIARAWLGEDAAQIAGFAAFIGHLFPVWLGFRGGKGVATFLGILLALAFPVGAAACAIWLTVALIMRYSSMSALFASGLSPIAAILLGQGQIAILCCALAILIFERHKANIRRLWNGEEPKIGKT
jgi:glycerol-3-phosphate acyltransferase PlsY